MKVLNLYAGIGGNRKLWEDVEVTAVELNPEIAKIYQDFYPNDKVIVADAHEYLLEHFKEFDFIWSSIECPSHSRVRFWSSSSDNNVLPVYPDMKLYEEILFLNNYYKGKFVVENVVPYYKPLINPTAKIGRHLFWANFYIINKTFQEANINRGSIKEYQDIHNVDISKYKLTTRRDKVLRNCVNPELGKYIFECSKSKQITLFS